ncbi:hypothetical protein HRI_003846100 [Hibiscus trionum]|uniref:Uncharacterized protein n=1 Tax=Hibiscus trionum TaxID=183268 RepID=A0A9W7IXL4_HIBTR|nr:hypothetical protein HRI_003846100 [Hibiscus trionum]
MAKQTPSSPLKRRKATSFSDTEMDVARQLMQLCRKYSDDINGNTGSKKEKRADETNPLDEEEEEHLQPRKKRFKSIDFIYRTTQPFIIQSHQNVKKMKMMCN